MNKFGKFWKEDTITGFVLIVGGLILFFFALPFELWGDGRTRFDDLNLLFSHGQVSHGKYSLLGPLFSAPLWLLGKWWISPEWWCARFNFFLFSAGLLAVWFLLRKIMQRGTLQKFI